MIELRLSDLLSQLLSQVWMCASVFVPVYVFAHKINTQCSATSPTSTGPTHTATDLVEHYHGCPRQANHLVTFYTYLEFSRNHTLSSPIIYWEINVYIYPYLPSFFNSCWPNMNPRMCLGDYDLKYCLVWFAIQYQVAISELVAGTFLGRRFPSSLHSFSSWVEGEWHCWWKEWCSSQRQIYPPL